MPKILYAPVAVTALDFGFNINEGGVGQVTTPVKLTPQLLARALTQVYKYGPARLRPSRRLGRADVGDRRTRSSMTADPAFNSLTRPARSPCTRRRTRSRR